MADLSQIVKAYDVRGVVPDQWDEPLAELFGAAFVEVTDADAIVVGHDMRPSSPGLSRAFARGAAAGRGRHRDRAVLDRPAVLRVRPTRPARRDVHRLHNPAQYNGIKMCRAGAAPVGQDTGLAEIRALVEGWSETGAAGPEPDAPTGTITQRDVLADYAAHLRSLVDLTVASAR